MNTVRGRVYKRGRTWHNEVLVGGTVVLADNAGDWRKILDLCNHDVYATRRITNAGHHLRSWDALVNEALEAA